MSGVVPAKALSSVTLTAPEGAVELIPISPDRYWVTLKPNDPTLFIPMSSCETSLSLEVITDFLNSSYPWLCDMLARHDEQGYVIAVIRRQLMAHFDLADFNGKRVLDFGCGYGASTLCMAAMLPGAELVGIELNQAKVEQARRVAALRGLSNVRFLLSPDGNSLPPDIGRFDFVMFSAVYEHLLPAERRRLMPLIWSILNPGGVLFINQTPYRYFPYEHHSTGLWLINYLPDRLAFWLAENFSKINITMNRSRSGEEHLRGGLRGATEWEILANLRRAGGGTPRILPPRQGDRAAYWLSSTSPDRHRAIKRAVAGLFRVTDRLFGTIPSMNVEVAIRKDCQAARRAETQPAPSTGKLL